MSEPRSPVTPQSVPSYRPDNSRPGIPLLGISLNLIFILLFVHLSVPRLRPYTSKAVWLSHYNPDTGCYGVGSDDLYFIGFCVVSYTGLRAFSIENILAPLGRRWGISKSKDIRRFSEQAWLLCYFSLSWTLGMYIYCTSKYFLNLREMFTDWPTRELPGITKAYILGQWAFWQQQLLVIHIENRRKDHWQMLTHHIVAIVLIYTSYTLHLTRVANLVLILMDVVDIIFPLAKCLRYLGRSTMCDIMFGVFMLSWFLARHILYLITMWGIWEYMAEVIPIGCYHGSQGNLTGPTPLPEHGWLHMLEPFRRPSGTICFSKRVQWGFLGALGFLQILTVAWLVMIIQVALLVLKGGVANDIRSDSESEHDERDMRKNQNEEGAGVSAVDRKPWKRRGGMNMAASSSSVRLAGHSDPKDLLGRVGCEKH
ncbi:longevity assurance proteins LAG1/LAC1 [Aspergillus avenaceus]|uniref:Longevity assurance proteins LAG1/LAC1 n=1 Tax=Aspergillus avenaceus TaxID=36643 RepID=A0A5N6TID8_ASPAV|nr:longevity assurance proteins LAG1/LAC1 [Aspergillus avenaceus]